MRAFLPAILVLALIGAIFAMTPGARADSVLTWTTAADFDAGTKLNASLPTHRDYFADNGIDQPTYSPISTPSAFYSAASQRTYVVWQGDSGYLPYIAYYDHSTGAWSTRVKVANYNPIAGDGHGAPALWVDSQGYIFVEWGAHSSAAQLAVSTLPNDISAWTIRSSPAPHLTYPHFFEYGGYVYMLYRVGNLSWYWEKTNDQGVSWVPGINFFQLEGVNSTGFYIDHAFLSGDYVFYVMVKVDFLTSARRDVYSCKWNLIDNHQYGLNGVDMGLNPTQADVDANCRITNGKEVSAAAVRLDSLDRPYVIYTVLSSTVGLVYTFDLNFTRWTGIAWTAPAKITTTDGSSSYADFIVNGNGSTITAFLTTGGLKDVAGDDYSGDLEEWSYNGTWSKVQTILSEADAGFPVNRPFVPMNHADPIRVVFDTWSWRHPTSEATLRLYAWGPSGFVGNNLPGSPSPLETITDNGVVPDGDLSVWNGYADTFSTPSPMNSSAKWQDVETGDGPGSTWSRVSGGTFQVTFNASGGTGRKGNFRIGAFPITGNWDVRVKMNVSDPADSGSLSGLLCMYSEPNVCDWASGPFSAGGVGVIYQAFMFPGAILRAYNGSNATINQVGADTAFSCTTCWLRLAKAGNQVSYYHSPDGSAWTDDAQYNFLAAPSTWYVSFGASGNAVTAGTWSMNFDNYALVAGTAGRYGRSGIWDSPLQPASSTAAKTLNLSYTTASNGSYISAVYVLDASGIPFFSYGPLPKNGTSVSLVLPNDLLLTMGGAAWRLRVVVVSDGATPFAIHEIALVLTASGVSTIESALWVVLFLVAVVMMVLGAWAVKRRFF